jgi:hypothetical protein
MKQQKVTAKHIDHHHHQMETLKPGLRLSSAASVKVPENDFTTLREWLDCTDQPFKVHTASLLQKRKRDSVKPQVQHGLFKEGLAVQYEVQPRVAWKSLRRYRRFTGKNGGPGDLEVMGADQIVLTAAIVGSESIAVGEFILVKHDGTDDSAVDSSSDWKAKVLEVRALDSEHVYIRVSWLNRPEDMAGGRQDYHGKNELVPTNQIDIIDAMSVNGKFYLKHWDEMKDIDQDDQDDTSEKDVYYWRQTFNFAEQRLSKKAKRRQRAIKNPPKYAHRHGGAVTSGDVGNKRKQNIGAIQETSIPHAERSSGRRSTTLKAQKTNNVDL